MRKSSYKQQGKEVAQVVLSLVQYKVKKSISNEQSWTVWAKLAGFVLS